MVQEDLGLVDQSPKGAGVDDAVPVTLKIISGRSICLVQTPAP
jgi:hypothetical protein